MIVQCPECKTTYNLDDDRIAPAGSKVRCSRCQHVFEVTRIAGPSPDDTVEKLTRPDPLVGDGSEAAPEQKKDVPRKKDDVSGGKNKTAGKKRGVFLWLLLVLLVLAGVGVGAYIFAPTLLNNAGTHSSKEKKIGEQKNSKAGVLQKISLENVRPYFVKNEKIGQIFVVEGKAVNGFKIPKELIRLRIKLFDTAGTVIASREFYCGNVVSSFQLQVLGEDALGSALSAKVGILTNNTNIKPGEGVPFMVTFTNPSESLQEFGLDVVEVKDPAPAK